jgi:aspartate racemase
MSRVIGVVGGTGPESTIDYYRRFLATWARRGPVGTYPRVIIDSVEGGGVISGLAEGRFGDVAEVLVEAVDELAAAGVGTALLASNASHLAYERVAARARSRSSTSSTSREPRPRPAGHRRLGLFGTRFVVESPLYPDRFSPAGIEIVIPDEADRAWIGRVYLDELVRASSSTRRRDRLVEIAAGMRDRDGIDGLILGGTELALILTEPTCAGLPVPQHGPDSCRGRGRLAARRLDSASWRGPSPNPSCDSPASTRPRRSRR